MAFRTLLATALAAGLVAYAAAQGPDRSSQAVGDLALDGTCRFTDPCDGQQFNVRPSFIFANSCGDEYIAERGCGVTAWALQPTPPPFVETHFDTVVPPGSATCAFVDKCSGGVIRTQQRQVFTDTCGVSYLVGHHCRVSLVPTVTASVGTPRLTALPPPTFTVGTPTLTAVPPPTFTVGTPTLTALSRREAKAKAAAAAKAASNTY